MNRTITHLSSRHTALSHLFDHKGEIAVQGYATIGEAGRYLITAVSDDYEGETSQYKGREWSYPSRIQVSLAGGVLGWLKVLHVA